MSFDEEDWNRPVMGSGARDTVRERRSTIENNNAVVDRITYPILYSSAIYKGKFFTRGCRGMLESIQVYCDGDAVDTLTLRYSPHPCIGPFGEVSIVPADGYAWQDFAIEEMWDYDSLFIWIHACTANITWGYDAWLPYDGHESTDAGATWADMAIRPFIRAVLTGETPGDVPVSGIINNIEILAQASERAYGSPNVPDGVETTICTIEGMGELIEARLAFPVNVVPAPAVQYHLVLIADGGRAMRWENWRLTMSYVAITGRITIGEFWQEETPTETHMAVRPPVKFRRTLTLRALETTGLGPMIVDGALLANMVR